MKKILIAAVLCFALLFAGCASESGSADYIGVDAAKEAALSSAGIDAEEAVFTSASLTEDDAADYYQVNFTAGGYDYEFRVNALTGVVIDCVLPDTTAEAEPDAAAESAEEEAESAAGTDASADTADQADSAEEEAQTGGSGEITLDEAKAIALAHADLSGDAVTFTKARTDRYDGTSFYKLAFYTADGAEYEYKIRISDGEILKFEMETELGAASSGTPLTADEAKALALTLAPGASESDIREFERDDEDGHTIYEGKIVLDGLKVEFEIDADSGTFLSWEGERT